MSQILLLMSLFLQASPDAEIKQNRYPISLRVGGDPAIHQTTKKTVTEELAQSRRMVMINDTNHNRSYIAIEVIIGKDHDQKFTASIVILYKTPESEPLYTYFQGGHYLLQQADSIKRVASKIREAMEKDVIPYLDGLIKGKAEIY